MIPVLFVIFLFHIFVAIVLYLVLLRGYIPAIPAEILLSSIKSFSMTIDFAVSAKSSSIDLENGSPNFLINGFVISGVVDCPCLPEGPGEGVVGAIVLFYNSIFNLLTSSLSCLTDLLTEYSLLTTSLELWMDQCGYD